MKPYLIFVEGQQSPYRIHTEEGLAFEEGKRLAAKFPGSEVHVLKIHKRILCEKGEVRSLGSHIPEFPNLNTTNLVPKSTNKVIKNKLEIVVKKAKVLEKIDVTTI